MVMPNLSAQKQAGAGADGGRRPTVTDALAASLPGKGAISASCAALGVSRVSLLRSVRRQSRGQPYLAKARPSPPRTLPAGPRQRVLDLLRSSCFADLAPAEIYATLLDDGIYHCSISTMYRSLAENSEVRERRKQLRHPVYTKSELLAGNQIRFGHGMLRNRAAV